MAQSTGGGDFGLSLSGSQITTPVSSSRRPGSAKRPSSSAGVKQKTSVPGQTPSTPKSHMKRSGSSGQLSQRSDVSSATVTGRTQRDDVMAFFESAPVQPQVRKPQPKQKKQKPAWASGNSARSISTIDSARSGQVSQTSKGSKFSHSIFQPTSARSNSTVEDEDEFNALMSKINQSQQDLEIESVSGFSTHRYANSDIVSNHNTDRSQRTLTPGTNRSNRQNTDRLIHGAANQNEPIQSTSQDDFDVLGKSNVSSVSLRTRNLSHGENDLSLSSPLDLLNEKATKLNSIANNMTSQGMSGARAKTPLEHSVQNIKHKTPINQVNDSVGRVNHNVNAGGLKHMAKRQDSKSNHENAEDLAKKREMSAIIIQRWYRRLKPRTKAGEAALRRMLETKKHQIEADRKQEVARSRNLDEERKRTREEKARAARQEAIRELQKKREDKRLENQKMVDEEMKYLQASGKVSKTPAHKSNVHTRPKVKGNKSAKKDSDSDTSPQRPNTGARSGRSTNRSKEPPLNHNTESPHLVNGFLDGHQPSDSSLSNHHTPRAAGNATSRTEETASPSQAGTKTTIDDLMATLKKLEQDETFEKFSARQEGGNKNEKPLAWLDDLEKTETDSKDDYLTSDKLERLDKDNLKKSGMLTDEKLRNIITYLDEVETAERLSQIDQELALANDSLGKPALLLPSGEELAQLEQASANAAEVTSTVLSQKMELEEKKRTVGILQKALNQQRELTVRHAKETEKEMKRRLDIQKDEYEETIKRHLSFIDQLIDDKKNLSEKCESLVKDLKQVDHKYGDRLKTMQENHDIELRKLKEVQAAAEKLRREKWIDEKTKKIKEMTVKGLEPEIQRLIAKHKAEVKKLKSIQEAELLASDERAGQKYIKMTEELRDQLAHEKEAACARERELARQTYEKQMQQEEEAYQQQRRRLYSEVQEEKERLASSASRQRAELDRMQRQLEDQHSTSTEAMRKEYEKAREEQERRHQAESKQLREQLRVEKTAWEENYMKKQDAWSVQKERELKDSVRKERDKEIELVIARLEEDNQNSREECERVAENRIKRIRDKYEAEMSELERSERQTVEKYNQTKAKLAEMEGENERMKVTLKQKDKEIIELKKLLDKLNEERSHVSDVIRQEFADKIVATDEENKRIKNEMSELKARHKIELERAKGEIEVVQKAKEEEMEEVHKRVKQAILKKEEVVTQLKQQHQAALKRADHLEGLLEQQRKQLLGKK